MSLSPGDADDGLAVPDSPASTEEDEGLSAAEPTVEQARRRLVTEDWLATIVGLTLIALVFAGVITKGMVP
jgi:hypothetical protein